MNITTLLKIALKALVNNKTRTFLTMLGIIIGVGSVISMLAIGQGSKKSIQDQVSGMGANLITIFPANQFKGGVMMGNSASQRLSVDDYEAIAENCPSVSLVSPEIRTSGQLVNGGKNAPSTIMGGNQDYLEIKKYKIQSGRMFNSREINSSAKLCVVGKTVVNNLFEKDENPIGQKIRFRNIPFKIIGVLSEKGQNTFGQDQDDIIIAPFTTVQKRILAITHIQNILCSAISESRTTEAVEEIKSELRKKHKLKEWDEDDFNVRTQQELIESFSSISNVLTVLLGAIAGISLLVGGIGIMNIMYVSVTERTREIGLRMAIGGKGKDILLQFLTESTLISVIGGILGVLLGIGASTIISLIMKWPVIVLPESVILAFAVCLIIGIFFGWYPARKAANLNPIDALRFE